MCLFFAYICIQQTVFNFDKQSKRQQRKLPWPVEPHAFTVKEVLQEHRPKTTDNCTCKHKTIKQTSNPLDDIKC